MNMMTEEATFPDVPQLCELLAILFEQEQEFSPDTAKQEKALRLLVGNPQRGRVFVCRDGATLAGMVTVQTLVSTACGGDVLLMEDLVVRPAYRNNGIGSALLDHAVCFAARGLPPHHPPHRHRQHRRAAFLRPARLLPLRDDAFPPAALAPCFCLRPADASANMMPFKRFEEHRTPAEPQRVRNNT